MSTVDARLLRPSFLPAFADIALASLRLWNRRGKAAQRAA